MGLGQPGRCRGASEQPLSTCEEEVAVRPEPSFVLGVRGNDRTHKLKQEGLQLGTEGNLSAQGQSSSRREPLSRRVSTTSWTEPCAALPEREAGLGPPALQQQPPRDPCQAGRGSSPPHSSGQRRAPSQPALAGLTWDPHPAAPSAPWSGRCSRAQALPAPPRAVGTCARSSSRPGRGAAGGSSACCCAGFLPGLPAQAEPNHHRPGQAPEAAVSTTAVPLRS